MRSLINLVMLWRLRWRSWMAQERYLLEPTIQNRFAADHWINKESRVSRDMGEKFHFHDPRPSREIEEKV